MEIDLNGYSKSIKELRRKKFTLRPIKRSGGWVGPEHDSAFMNDGAVAAYTVPSKAVGRGLVNPCPYFEVDEKKDINDWQALADELGLESVRDLNPNTKKCFWMREAESTVRVDKNGMHLDLMDTRGFVDYIVLRSNTHIIAPNWQSRFDSGEFKFALVEEGEELVDKVSNIEQEKKAYRFLDKIDNSANKMMDFLYVYYLTKKDAKKPPTNASVDWLKNECGRIIKEDLNIFLAILDDKDYNLKLLIQRSVETGALLKQRNRYYLPGEDDAIGSIDDVITYLDDPRNQAVRVKLMHHVEGRVEA